MRPLSNLKYLNTQPFAFTEHGAIMAASVLNSSRATEASIFIVRAFIKLRSMLAEHKELTRKTAQIEHHLAEHDEQILALIKVLKQFIQPAPVPKKRRIGF